TVELQWGHGDHAVDDAATRRNTSGSGGSFNGATAITPWMTQVQQPFRSPSVQLQWGHGDHAVDDVPDLPRAGTLVAVLQWGHGDHAVDDSFNVRGLSLRSR